MFLLGEDHLDVGPSGTDRVEPTDRSLPRGTYRRAREGQLGSPRFLEGILYPVFSPLSILPRVEVVGDRFLPILGGPEGRPHLRLPYPPLVRVSGQSLAGSAGSPLGRRTRSTWCPGRNRDLGKNGAFMNKMSF